MEPEEADVEGTTGSLNAETSGDNQSGLDTATQQVEQTNTNPAWDPVLKVIPQTLHSAIVPHLRKWDENYQQLATQYAPYKEFSKNGVTPDHVVEALQVRDVLLNNPKFLYDRMVQQFGKEWGVATQTPQQEQNQTQESQVEDFGDDISKHPKFVEMAQQNEVIAKYLLAQEEAKQAAAEDAALEQEWQGFAKKHPHIANPENERIIFSVAAAQGLSLEDAVNWFLTTPAGRMQQQQRTAPVVIPTSGGVPSNGPVDVGKLSDQDTRKLVTEYINALRG